MDRETQREFARMENWQRDHLQIHATEAERKRSDRRWMISGVIIPTLAVLVSAAWIILTLHP